MKHLTIKTVFTIFILFFLACSEKEEVNNEELFDGSTKSIEAYYTPELVEAIKDLGMALNTGNTPPYIEGHFLAAPFLLKKSSVPDTNDFEGKVFADYELTLLNQKNETLSIDFIGQTVNGSQKDIGDGAFIAGENNSFSIFLKTETTKEKDNISYKAMTALVISGTISENGIKDLEAAFMMLDDNDDLADIFIPNNTGRLIYDSDMFSAIID